MIKPKFQYAMSLFIDPNKVIKMSTTDDYSLPWRLRSKFSMMSDVFFISIVLLITPILIGAFLMAVGIKITLLDLYFNYYAALILSILGLTELILGVLYIAGKLTPTALNDWIEQNVRCSKCNGNVKLLG